MQRLCFWSGFLYYIDTAINVFVVSLPPILMAVLAPEAVSVNNYLFVFLALIVRMSIVPVITMGSESMTGLTRIQSTYSFAHALALFDAIRGRTDAWQATGVKGGTPTARRVRRLMMTWCVLVQGSDVGHLPMAGTGARLVRLPADDGVRSPESRHNLSDDVVADGLSEMESIR